MISSREDRLRCSEFAPARDYGSEGYRFESCRARYLSLIYKMEELGGMGMVTTWSPVGRPSWPSRTGLWP